VTTQLQQDATILASAVSEIALRPPRRSDHRYYAWAGAAAFAIVLAGFARTYYLKFLFGTPALPWLLHLHGALMTSWFALFLVQTCLIAAHRVAWHRRLGVGGVALAVLMVTVAPAVIIEAQRRHISLGHPQVAGMAFQLGLVLVFAILVSAALVLRRRSDFHKRFMMLASLSILSPGIVRVPAHFIQRGGLFSLFGILDLLIVVCVSVDAVNRRRVHPAFVWGGLLIILSQPLSLVLGATSGWTRFARWLVS
jgi:hypothetical protein